jgi:hypothetical protein
MFNRLRLQLYLVTYMLPMDYLSMVMMFQFNSQERLTYIHSRVENHMKICLIKDHLIETHLEDCHMTHALDFTNC